MSFKTRFIKPLLSHNSFFYMEENEESGKFSLYWAKDCANGKLGQKVPIYTIDGYKFLKFNGKYMAVHVLVWQLMENRVVPEGHQVDHINNDATCYQPWNLRLTTISQNMVNRRKMNGAKEGALPKGVQKTAAGTFKAALYVEGKMKHLGTFPTPELAHECWKEHAMELHGEYFNEG